LKKVRFMPPKFYIISVPRVTRDDESRAVGDITLQDLAAGLVAVGALRGFRRNFGIGAGSQS
jgi:hypothetical protein